MPGSTRSSRSCASTAARRQLFPVVERDHLSDGQTYRGLRLAGPGRGAPRRPHRRRAGLVGPERPTSRRSSTGYATRLRRLRPGYDLAGAAHGRPAAAATRCADPARPSVACAAWPTTTPTCSRALLDHARERAARQGQAFLMVGFDDREPLLRSLRPATHGDLPKRRVPGLVRRRGHCRGSRRTPVHVEIGAL